MWTHHLSALRAPSISAVLHMLLRVLAARPAAPVGPGLFAQARRCATRCAGSPTAAMGQTDEPLEQRRLYSATGAAAAPTAPTRVAVAQMTSVGDVDANFECVKKLVEVGSSARRCGARLLCSCGAAQCASALRPLPSRRPTTFAVRYHWSHAGGCSGGLQDAVPTRKLCLPGHQLHRG